MQKYFIGFDCGTNESKGCLCDNKGTLLAKASRKHKLIIPLPGYAEHDPIGHWWEELKSIVPQLLEEANVKKEDIAGIGISTVMAAVTFVDENLRPLRNSILYGIDTRSVEQCKELNEKIGKERLFETCGNLCTVESYGAKILWVKENEPEIYAKTKHITFAAGFLVAKLTGKFVVDKHSVSSATPMIDINKYEWDDELCSFVCPKEMLPEIKDGCDIAGYTLKDSAEELGLIEGIPVVVGTTDAATEALSVGVVNPGDTMLMYGSTAFILNLSDQAVYNKLLSAPYILPGLFDNCAGMGTTGSLTAWVKEVMAKELIADERNGGRNSYDALFEEADSIPPGSDGVVILPYFAGQRMPISDPEARGLIFGLRLNHTRGHIVRATFEAIAFGLSQLIDNLESNGLKINNVRAVGGGTKTPLLLQTVSDVCNIRQEVTSIRIGASYGDALLAAIGTGFLTKDDIASLVKVENVITPNLKNYEKYKHYKEIYNKLGHVNRSIMHEV